jgi:hypothetical protein
MMLHLRIRPELFWDLDKNRMSEETSRRIIIERVLTLGNLSEWQEIVRYYGLYTIKKEIRNAGTLDPKTIAFIETYLKINKEGLRCYIKKQLTPTFCT